MEDKSSNFNKRPAIEKPSLEEVGYERLRDAKEQRKRLEEKIHSKLEGYIEQQIKPHEDIGEEAKELKQRLFETYKDQWITPLKEDAKVYEDSLGEAIDTERRVSRKLRETEREVRDISEFELKRAFETALRDIHSEKDKKA